MAQQSVTPGIITVSKKVSGAIVVSSETAEFFKGYKNGCIELF